MTFRERIHTFWQGEKPDKIPYAIYWGMWKRSNPEDPNWQKILAKGLGVCFNAITVTEKRKNVLWDEQYYTEDKRKYKRTTMKTPIGEIYQIHEGDWPRKYWIENEQDYKVMLYILRNTELLPNYEEYYRQEKIIKNEVGNNGVIRIPITRTPIQIILVNYLGLENFALHLYDYQEQIQELHKELLCKLKKRTEITADGPGKYLWCADNFSADTMGPAMYEKYLLSAYKEFVPILHQAGKIIGVHYDGRTKVCKDLIAQAPVDMIESLTPPPEGDMTIAECRQAWPNKLFWVNINVSQYQRPPRELKKYVHALIEQADADGKKIAFELSEDLPVNWRESVPVVLDALNETF
jgi:hypothetical protein